MGRTLADPEGAPQGSRAESEVTTSAESGGAGVPTSPARTEEDRRFMSQALELAARGIGHTSPNPAVGAVLVRNGEVVGTGYHRRCGGPHAEIFALQEAGGRARGATLYVTLEPCCVSGQTPPCTDALIAAGVARVVVPVLDPNPSVRGLGLDQLRSAGISVERGLMEPEAVRLNAPYFKYRREGLPFVLLKLAASLDGRVAPPPGGPRWTTSEASREMVHQMRSAADCIMVGVGTVLADNPRLTDRRAGAGEKQPARLVVDTRLRTPPDAAVLSGEVGQTIVACGDGADASRRRELERTGAMLWTVETGADGRLDLEKMLRRAGAEGFLSIMAEGGPSLATSLLNSDLVDRVVLFIAPRLYGSGGVQEVDELDPIWWAGESRFRSVVWRGVGGDCLFEADVERKPVGKCSRD